MSRDRIENSVHSTHLRRDTRARTVLARVTLAAFMTLLPWTAGAQLTPAIQADLYLVQTEEFLKEKDYDAALEAMTKLIKLAEDHELTVPAEFHFKHAQVLNTAGEYAEAGQALHRYLERAGQAGAHYREALTLLHQVSEAEEAEKAAATAARAAATAARAAAERKAAAARAATARAAAAAKAVAQKMRMVVVPAGNFQMGSPSSEQSRHDDEGPVHRVTIASAFAVGVYEVTFEEWDACVDVGGCGGYRPDDEGWGRGRRPVINVGWEEAQRFVAWLREGTGEGYRLLSEAEWEYVARAGTTTPFHTGATIATSQANYDGDYTYGNGRKGVDLGKTVPVGSFSPNAFGVYDVHGNVWEWVEDCRNDSYRGAPSDGSAWERGDCSRRVLRGGSWYFGPRYLRSAYRGRNYPGLRYWSLIGFRVARTLDS